MRLQAFKYLHQHTLTKSRSSAQFVADKSHHDQYGSVSTPIYPSTTYRIIGYDLSNRARALFKHPNLAALENKLGELENGKHVVVTGSGQSAIALTAFSLLNAGDHVVFHQSMYNGSSDLFADYLKKYKVEGSAVDFNNKAALDAAIKPNTRILFYETPTTPLLEIIDIAAMSKLAKSKGILTVVDNTLATPLNQRPLDYGADVVIQSLTKYLGGHHNVHGGAVITNNNEIAKKLQNTQEQLGSNLSPESMVTVLTGLKTLIPRMWMHQKNADKIAHFLSKHPSVEKVSYPGLTSHPQYALASRQMKKASGIVSFWLKGGLSAVEKFIKSLKVWQFAPSFGGVESILMHPASFLYGHKTAAEKEALGISDNLIRLSVGLENSQSLVQDLQQALEKSQQSA